MTKMQIGWSVALIAGLSAHSLARLPQERGVKREARLGRRFQHHLPFSTAAHDQLVRYVAERSATRSQQPFTNGGVPVVSSDGAHIAFTSDRSGAQQVYVILADGSGEMQLTHSPERKGAVQWTADGTHVAFAIFTTDTSRLYEVDATGQNLRLIASVPGREPALSPDNKRVLFVAGTWTSSRVMASDLSGTEVSRITDGTSIAWNNHWSPDGKQIALTSRTAPNAPLSVFVMNADGSGRRQVTHLDSAEGGAQWPVWSPDGRQLAMQVNLLQQHSAHIWVADVASGEAHRIAPHDRPYLDETPAWFPDGRRIAFQSNRTGRMEVWTMNADGLEQRQVTGRDH